MLRAALTALCAGHAAGAELLFAAVNSASAGQHTLTVTNTVNFGTYGFTTRGYGSIPGPTFRMKPGETLQIRVQNNLSAANNVACTLTAGEFCESATTNLHTHGLHVSSKGVEDGLPKYSDDIFAEIQPGESADFAFAIPSNHMGGTHWYHPHHHHATALQAGGGAAGVLIVEDPDGYLPSVYADMPEKILFISGHNLVTLQDMAQSAQSTILEGAVAAANQAGLDTNVFLVNGQIGPTMSLESHTWHRLRMVYAAVEQGLDLTVSGDATCQMMLLAKDGVYLSTMPRNIPAVILFPGARADVAFSCTCTSYPCTGVLGSAPARRLQGPARPGMGGGGAGPNAPGGNMATVELLQLNITQGPSSSVVTLPSTSVKRPCYLVDLQSATVANGNSNSVNLVGGGRLVQFNGAGTSMTYANTHANGASMATWPPLANFAVGTVQELEVTGVAAHPLHIHVDPYQITAMPAASYYDGYFAVGDWHDTLMIDTLGGGSVTVRMQTDRFTGKMVVHCHILEHEDEGMMAFFNITGDEGTGYSSASALDSTCYEDAFDAGTSTNSTGNTSNTSNTGGSNAANGNTDTSTTAGPIGNSGDASGAARSSVVWAAAAAGSLLLARVS